MAFCSLCGCQISDESKFCPNCGKTLDEQNTAQQQTQNTQTFQQQGYQQSYQPNYQQGYQPNYQQNYRPYYAPLKNIVEQLSDKVKIQAILWLVVSCIQYLVAFIFIIYGLSEIDYGGAGFIIAGILYLAAAGLNTFFCVQSFDYYKKILKNPIGIIQKYAPIGGHIAILIYNILFGGIVGLAGAIFALVIRNFVMTNEAEFAQIEYNFMSNAH